MIALSRKSRMNLRHAAALALVGWYLMLPPFIRVGPDPREPGRDIVAPDSAAPLSKWFWSGSFDSVEACERSQEKEITETQRRNSLKTSFHARIDRDEMAFREARCIATDDPRLKEK
jgi:hypothetical protein